MTNILYIILGIHIVGGILYYVLDYKTISTLYDNQFNNLQKSHKILIKVTHLFLCITLFLPILISLIYKLFKPKRKEDN